METAISAEMRNRLRLLFLESVRIFVETIYEFTEPEFNQVPASGGWSAAQVSSHVNKSMRLIHDLVIGEVAPTQRAIDLHLDALNAMMEDMTTKGKSAEVLLPVTDFVTRTERRLELTEALELQLHDIDSKELSLLCAGMDFPGLGLLTRYEIISFSAFHIIRHKKQLQNIHKDLPG